jgi:hypothetical protein
MLQVLIIAHFSICNAESKPNQNKMPPRQPRAQRGRGQARRRRGGRLQDIDNMTREQLIDLIERQDFTIRRRGAQIHGLYWSLHQLLNNHPHAQRMPDNSAALQEQLTAARDRIRALMAGTQQRPATVAAPTQNNPYNRVRFGCNVCWETMADGPRQPVALMCGHIFCRTCIGAALDQQNHECPSCRTPMDQFIPLFFNSMLEVADNEEQQQQPANEQSTGPDESEVSPME